MSAISRVGVGVVGGAVDGARGGVPRDPEVLQEIRNPVIEEVVEPRVVGSQRVVNAEQFQVVLQPLREPQRVVTGELIDGGGLTVSSDFAIGGAAVVPGSTPAPRWRPLIGAHRGGGLNPHPRVVGFVECDRIVLMPKKFVAINTP